MAGDTRQAAELAAEKIQEYQSVGKCGNSDPKCSLCIAEMTAILCKEFAATIERCAQIADEYDCDATMGECCGAEKGIAAAIRSLKEAD